MIYIRTKKSGNFEFSNAVNADLKFRTKKELKNWFTNNMGTGRLIKATYTQSQTYYANHDFDAVWKMAKELFN